jgi:cell division initiation protein
MALTPVEIRHITFGRSFLGYKRPAVDKLLADIAMSFEDVWRERADLADKLELVEADLVRYKELETLLRTTLVSAERASTELREQARKQAELIVEEAVAEARSVTRHAAVENERLRVESLRMRERLRLALASVEEHLEDEPESTQPEEAEAA